MRVDYADEKHWTKLAKRHGIRLPRSGQACTSGKIEKWLRKLDMSPAEFRRWGGYKSLKDFVILNPDWELRELVGLLLELKEEGK